jgi:calcyphosin
VSDKERVGTLKAIIPRFGRRTESGKSEHTSLDCHTTVTLSFKMSRTLSRNRTDLESKADELERRLKEKVQVMTGFADPEILARKLQSNFSFFDLNGSGTIDYQEFFAAMTKLNFIGVQKEIETLFNRYDEDASGTIDYKEFSYYLFNLGNKPTLDLNSRNIVEKVKARILEKDGASGIHKVARILRRMDSDGSKTLDPDELMAGLREYGINRIPPSELQILFNYFDRDRSGKISVEEFLRGLKVTDLLSPLPL